MRSIKGFLIIIVAFASFAFISLDAKALPTIPNHDQILVQYGKSSDLEIRVDRELRITIWNVQKFTNGPAYRDLFKFATNSDLVLLQESMMGENYASYYTGMTGLTWTGAISFFDGPSGTGVMTASRAKPTYEGFVQSEAREPIFSTPKMIAITKYKIAGSSDELMVANIHGINFVTTWIYESQIAQLKKAVKNHKGPLIVTGDFNTHMPDRYLVIKDMADSLGLKYVLMENQRFDYLILDHIFVRGLETKSARVLYEVNTSDHYPLEFTGQLTH
ncbi:MAG: hypothetical protein A2Z20_11790 [Bdellovibrionales bacterium RBG_16_40_8]|nr:MAG: hypothetical protein A2Z20_11790 [Bdellovibrionales bacterium RBG_16_40_8]